MEKWRAAICDPELNDGASFFLLNSTKTLVRVHSRLHFDPLVFFKKLEKIGLPFRFTDGLEVINFTVLPESTDAIGYYIDNRIYVDVSQKCIDRAVEVFIHEVGHHVDDTEGISPILHDERLVRAKHLHEKFSRRNDEEYLATGFEKYYSDDPVYRRKLRKKNPILYKTIQVMHRTYRKK